MSDSETGCENRPVVIVSTGKVYGGGERYVEQVADVYKSLGLCVYFIVRNQHLRQNLQRKQFEKITPVSAIGGSFGVIVFLIKNRSKLKTGFIHLNGHRDVVFAPIVRLMGLKPLVYRHTELFRDGKFRSAVKLVFYQLCVPFASGLICVSETVGKQVRKMFLLPSVVVLSNWLDERNFHQRQARRNSDGHLNVLIIARIDPMKGHRVLFTACENLTNIKIHVVGDGDHGLMEEFENKPEIIFHGFCEDVRPYFEQADVFVLPTHSEGSPLAILEAMGSALPVVLSDIPAISEFIEDGVNGLLFQVGDPQSLKIKLIQLMENFSLRKKLGIQAYQYVSKHRSSKIASRKIIKLIRDFDLISM